METVYAVLVHEDACNPLVVGVWATKPVALAAAKDKAKQLFREHKCPGLALEQQGETWLLRIESVMARVEVQSAPLHTKVPS